MQPIILCKVKIIIITCSDYNNNFENGATKEDNKKVKIKVD